MPLDFNNKSDDAKWIRHESPSKMPILAGLTQAGVMPDLSTPRSKDLIGALSQTHRIDWSKTFAAAKGTLASELSSSLKSHDIRRSAQLKIAAQELQTLSESAPDARYSLIEGLRQNDKKFVQLKADAFAVYKTADPFGRSIQVSENQRTVITDVDHIDAKPLQLELRSIDTVIGAETDPKLKVQLEQQRTDVLSTMAAPFVERCRMAALRDTSRDPIQEELDLNEAMQTVATIPAEAWQLESNRQFHDDMTKELKELHVYNNLPEIFDANLAKLDLIDHDGVVTRAELKTAEDKHDPSLTPLINVLYDYYNQLTDKNPPASKDGITSAGVKAFTEGHLKLPNDVPHRG